MVNISWPVRTVPSESRGGVAVPGLGRCAGRVPRAHVAVEVEGRVEGAAVVELWQVDIPDLQRDRHGEEWPRRRGDGELAAVVARELAVRDADLEVDRLRKAPRDERDA